MTPVESFRFRLTAEICPPGVKLGGSHFDLVNRYSPEFQSNSLNKTSKNTA